MAAHALLGPSSARISEQFEDEESVYAAEGTAAHALLGPSSAKRWLMCTPSARISEQFEDEESVYAAEGTAAHTLSELYLYRNIYPLDEFYVDKVVEFKESEGFYNGEMEESVNMFVDNVWDRFDQVRQNDPSAMLLPEQRIDFSDYVPEGFGTGDVTIIGNGMLEIIDLKYGKGVAVDAYDNPQLKLYGLGAYNTYKLLYDIDTIRMTIIQPRLDSVSVFDMKVSDLIKWAEEYVRPRAKLAFEGVGECVAGDHCRFCKAKIRCRAYSELNLSVARYEFRKADLLSDQEIIDIIAVVDELKSYARSIHAYALKEAENGKKWPGLKLVAGRSNRRYTDALNVETRLIANDYKSAMIHKPPEILGITAMQSLLGKKKLEEVLGDLIIKAPGKPTLVDESDKRPELNSSASARADFKEAL